MGATPRTHTSAPSSPSPAHTPRTPQDLFTPDGDEPLLPDRVARHPDAGRPPDALSHRHGGAFDVSEGDEVCVAPEGFAKPLPGVGPGDARIGSLAGGLGSAPRDAGSVPSDAGFAPGGAGNVQEGQDRNAADVADGSKDAENVLGGRERNPAEVVEGRQDADSEGGERCEEEAEPEPDQAVCRPSGEFLGLGVVRDPGGSAAIAEGGLSSAEGGGDGSAEGVCPAGSHGGEGGKKPYSSRWGEPDTHPGAGDAEGDRADRSKWDHGAGVDMAGGEHAGVDMAGGEGEDGPDEDTGWGMPQKHASHGGEEEIFGETTTDLKELHGENGTPQRRESDAATVGLIRQFAEEMAALNKNAGKDCTIM